MAQTPDGLWNRVIKSKYFILGIIFLVLMASWALTKSLFSRRAIDKDIESLKEEVTALDNKTWN